MGIGCWVKSDQRAAALASYAKQANDDGLLKTAVRIQARAIRRYGELLKQIEIATGAHLKRNGTDTLSRTQAAEEAGLSNGTVPTRTRATRQAQSAYGTSGRHLNESQRSMVAARLANLKDGQRKSAAQICAASQDEAADQLNISRRTVQHARKVLDLGLPELAHIVEQGEMPVSTAAAVAERNKACNHLVFRLNVLDDSALPR